MEEEGPERALSPPAAGVDGEKGRESIADELMGGKNSPNRGAGGGAGKGDGAGGGDGDADGVNVQAPQAKKPRLKFGFGLIREVGHNPTHPCYSMFDTMWGPRQGQSPAVSSQRLSPPSAAPGTQTSRGP